MKKAIIEVRKLNKTYEYSNKKEGLKNSFRDLFKRKKLYKHAVKDVSFDIQEGELVGFLGPNGAGKTTTLKMLSGILTPSSGEMKIMGFDPSKREEKYQMQFAFVMGQKSQLWWDLPAMESFILNKEIYEISDKDFKERLDGFVELLDVKDVIYKQVRQLSLGERMKCELIASLLHAPKVLFLDEPTIGMDVVAQKNIRDFIKKYNKEKKVTIILTSHYMEDILQLCERIIIINLGQVIYDGPMDALIRKYAANKLISVSFENEVKSEDVEKFEFLKKFEGAQASFDVPREKVKDVAREILSSNLPVKDIDISEEDVDAIIRNIYVEKK